MKADLRQPILERKSTINLPILVWYKNGLNPYFTSFNISPNSLKRGKVIKKSINFAGTSINLL